MSEKATAAKGAAKGKARPKIQIPLTTQEIINVVLLSLALGGLFVGSKRVLDQQLEKVKELNHEAMGLKDHAELARIQADRRRADKLTVLNRRWQDMLDRIEAYFPRDREQAISYYNVLAALAVGDEIQLKGSSQSGESELVFWPPESDEDDEEEEEEDEDDEESGLNPIEEEAPENLEVYYTEKAYKVSARITFRGWLAFLQNMEGLGRYYRLKAVSLDLAPDTPSTSSSGDRSKKSEESAAPERAWLDLNLQLGAYSVDEISLAEDE